MVINHTGTGLAGRSRDQGLDRDEKHCRNGSMVGACCTERRLRLLFLYCWIDGVPDEYREFCQPLGGDFIIDQRLLSVQDLGMLEAVFHN